MKNWIPSEKTIHNSNIGRMMKALSIDSYDEFWKWSVDNKNSFWETTVDNLGIVFNKKHTSIVDVSNGVESARWLYGSKLNIIDSCFQNSDDSIAVILNNSVGEIEKISQKDLELKVNSVANGLLEQGLIAGDSVALFMAMTLEAVVIYLAAIKAGMTVVTIADSFSVKEISVRLKITNPKMIFTQDGFKRGSKIHLLYEKCMTASSKKCIVVKYLDKAVLLKDNSILYTDFISPNTSFDSVTVDPNKTNTILFSSGTTGEPKAIPWDHTTPIKSASDGFYHHNIQKGDVICWPTNLGWMMGPWLVYASLINKATIALYSGSPLEEGFGKFVASSQVSMLGLVPSIVNAWNHSKVMEQFDWSSIKCFSSTGEVSNKTEMEYLMQLANHKPIIEYCGGTEIGGGYVASTLVQENIPSQFSTQTLGGEFVLLDKEGELSDTGEVFLIPPILGLSTRLINQNHHDVYYNNLPRFRNKQLRKHGDALCRLNNGYFKANGRVDDTMNLGGIKIASVQIESVINTLDFIKESAAISVVPKDGGPDELVVYFVSKYTISDQDALKIVQTCVKSELNPLFKVIDLVKIDNLPRTASKKVKRKELRKIYQNL